MAGRYDGCCLRHAGYRSAGSCVDCSHCHHWLQRVTFDCQECGSLRRGVSVGSGQDVACDYRFRCCSRVGVRKPLLNPASANERRCIALYYRLTIPETPRYTFDVARDVEKAGEDTKAYIQGKAEGRPDEVRRATIIADSEGRLETPKASWGDFVSHYRQWKFGKVLLGTAGSWFFLDVAFYGLGLNNSIILGAIGYSKGANMYEVFRRNAIGNLILVCAGAIPGYWVTVFTVDTLGRKPIQLMGFTMLTILFVIIGFAYDKLLKHNGALLALYVLAQFFFNFGKHAA